MLHYLPPPSPSTFGAAFGRGVQAAEQAKLTRGAHGDVRTRRREGLIHAGKGEHRSGKGLVQGDVPVRIVLTQADLKTLIG